MPISIFLWQMLKFLRYILNFKAKRIKGGGMGVADDFI